MQRPHTTMPWSMIHRIIDESVLYGTTSFCPFLMQEPLLEPRLLPILRTIKQQNHHLSTTIYSNMSLMTEERAREILDARVLDTLEVSFYAPSAEIYEHLQPPLQYDVTAQNLRTFMDMRQSGGYETPTVNLHYIAMPALWEGMPDFVNTWKDVVDSIGMVHYDNWHGDRPDLEREAYWQLYPETERYPCPRIWNTLNILSNGDVVPCCIDYEGLEPMGNLTDRHVRLIDIWRGPRFQAFRQQHINREFSQIPLCKECTIWRYQHPQEWNTFWHRSKLAPRPLTT